MINSLYEKFQHWSDTGSVWLISDPHFEDEESLEMNPDYLSAYSPDKYVQTLNNIVYKSDTLICLGDCGDVRWFSKLKAGHKVLIKGNHDDKGDSFYKKYFQEVYSGPLFVGEKLLLSHEPIDGLKFCTNIHGHSHGGKYDYTDEFGGRHLNIAADIIQWQPVSLGKLIKSGLISGLSTIHRLTIDKAIERKKYDS